uniref:HMG box domain-containing protein n=1 Tax=Eutreptiella gymnastica TaxID=73025 RepID=A0A7S1J758_9EUGL|mmetsp:Transcript_72383/g.127632  ORF Transcript_72383/g.127632 Transcript_72383/m.127632 type:complete len:186 (+) Transcript_72383:105-662(+)
MGAPQPTKGYLAFIEDHQASLKRTNPNMGFVDISHRLQEMWNAMSQEEQETYGQPPPAKPAPARPDMPTPAQEMGGAAASSDVTPADEDAGQDGSSEPPNSPLAETSAADGISTETSQPLATVPETSQAVAKGDSTPTSKRDTADGTEVSAVEGGNTDLGVLVAEVAADAESPAAGQGAEAEGQG